MKKTKQVNLRSKNRNSLKRKKRIKMLLKMRMLLKDQMIAQILLIMIRARIPKKSKTQQHLLQIMSMKMNL